MVYNSRGSKQQWQQWQQSGRCEYRAGYSQEGTADFAFENGAGEVASGFSLIEQHQQREHEENHIHD